MSALSFFIVPRCAKVVNIGQGKYPSVSTILAGGGCLLSGVVGDGTGADGGDSGHS